MISNSRSFINIIIITYTFSNKKDHGGKSKYEKQKSHKNAKQAVKESNTRIKPVHTETSQTEPKITNLSKDLSDVLEISQKPVDKFKKREIQSNWAKYESPIEDSTSAATNFEYLMNAPISTGGHFQFKSEKNMQIDLTNEYREYFSLNINKLAKSLETLPFYVRHELDKSLFTADEIKTMDSKCTTVENDCIDKMTKILQESDKPNYVLKTPEPIAKDNVEIQRLNTLEDDLDELLDLKMPENETNITDVLDNIDEPELNIPKMTTSNNRTKLENWLDDLLQ